MYSPLVYSLCFMLSGTLLSLHSGPGAETQADFYVATDGQDSWSGTLSAPNSDRTDGPFATCARSQVAVREKREGESVPCTALIRGGIYRLERPIHLVFDQAP